MEPWSWGFPWGSKPSCPWAPSYSCPSPAASQLKMCSKWWTPWGSSGSHCSQGTPALALIQANLGHFLQVPELDLMPLATPQALPLMLVYGTFWQHWPCILLKGVSCWGRMHIHLASGLPGDCARCHQWHVAKL